MECLHNYVGLRGCGNTTPYSGLYINDLPGISLQQLVALTNEEESTYVQLWDMIQRRAANRFSLDVREALSKNYKIKNLLKAFNFGDIIDGVDTNPANLNYNYQGFTIEMLESENFDYIGSPLASIYVQELKLYVTDLLLPTVDVKIFDLNTSQELFTYTLTKTQIGWNTIPVYKTFHNNYSTNSWSLYCVYGGINEGTCAFMDIPLDNSVINCCDVRVRGYLTNNVNSQYEFTSNTYGLTGTFSVVCSWDAVICQNKNLFTRPWWYLLGIETITEQLYSNKLNKFTTVNISLANELRKEYQVEYMRAMEQIAMGFSLDCDCCIECSGGVQLRESNQFY